MYMCISYAYVLHICIICIARVCFTTAKAFWFIFHSLLYRTLDRESSSLSQNIILPTHTYVYITICVRNMMKYK